MIGVLSLVAVGYAIGFPALAGYLDCKSGDALYTSAAEWTHIPFCDHVESQRTWGGETIENGPLDKLYGSIAQGRALQEDFGYRGLADVIWHRLRDERPAIAPQPWRPDSRSRLNHTPLAAAMCSGRMEQ